MEPEEIRRTAPEVRYILIRTSDFAPEIDGQRRLLSDYPIVKQLLLADMPPAGFSVLHTIYYATDSDSVDIYARLYKIAPAPSN